jgi:hypothetical protein
MKVVGAAKIHEFDTLCSIRDGKISSQDMVSMYGYSQFNELQIGLLLRNHWATRFHGGDMGEIASVPVRMVCHRVRVRLAIDWWKIVLWLAAMILPWGAIAALGYWFIHSSADRNVPETDVLRPGNRCSSLPVIFSAPAQNPIFLPRAAPGNSDCYIYNASLTAAVP